MRWLMVALACVGCRVRFDERTLDAPANNDASDSGCATIPGLLAYYPMNAGDIAAGGVLRDRSGNQRDAQLVDDDTAPTINAMGHLGESLDFTATPVGNYAYAETAGLPLPTADGEAITISIWFFRVSAGAMDNDVLVDVPRLPRYDLWLNANRVCINTANSDCWGVQDMTTYDRWVNVVAIMRNGPANTSELYLDGVAQVSTCINGATFPCTTSRTLGAPFHLSSSESTYTYRGLFDEVRIYDHALTPSQIAALAQDQTCL